MHSGEIEKQEIVIPAKGKQIQICFYAVKNRSGQYIDCIEVTQDVTDLFKKSKLKSFIELLKK